MSLKFQKEKLKEYQEKGREVIVLTATGGRVHQRFKGRIIEIGEDYFVLEGIDMDRLGYPSCKARLPLDADIVEA